MSSVYRFLRTTWLALLFITIDNYPGYSQNSTVIPANTPVISAGNGYSDELLDHYVYLVDSFAHTTGVAGHFARIYTASMGNINVQLKGKDSGAQAFIKRFETSFIGFFIHECFEFEKKQPIGNVWDFYFAHPEAQSWQLTLIGVNAHINGDIWKGLVNNFSEQEIRRYKKDLLSFQKSISKAFQPFFEDLMAQSSYLRFMNAFTKGSARQYGEWLIYKWRLRQINLAILYFTNPKKFKKKFAMVNRKKHRIDEMILKRG